MKGSRTFTRQAAKEIVVLLGRTRAASRADQKVLRQQIRDRGFYISDFNRPASGFGPDDFQDLVRAGVIRIT
jgi:hypothetical protein